MRNAIALFVAAAATLSLQSACNRDRASETTTTGAGIMTTDDAVNQLTARRCEREVDCDHVGSGKHFEDLGACERQVDAELMAELRPTRCIYGVREDRLSQCLRELRDAKCGSAVDTIGQLATCRTGRLCIE